MLAALCLAAGPLAAGEHDGADGADGGEQDAGDGPLPYRSRLEAAAAVPGKLLFVPFWLAFQGSKVAAVAVWEQHLLTRAAAALTTADGRTGVRPLSNTSLGTGARLFHRRPGGPDAQVLTTFGRDLAKRRHHEVEVGHRVAGRRSLLTASLRREPGESFYGLSMDTRRRDRTRYTSSEVDVAWTWKAARGQHLGLEGAVAYRGVDIGAAGDGSSPSTVVVYDSRLPGLSATVRHLSLRAAVRSQRVDVPGSPRHGNISRLQAGVHADVSGTGLAYVSLTAVTEQFQELFYGRTLSLRGGLDWRRPVGDDEVPFFDLASVGGDLFVRGYQRGRFRDRGAGFVSGRYKFPVWKLLDGTLFYEAGRTFASRHDLSLRDWRGSWGGGLRLWVPSGVVFDQWVAFSDEEWRLLFSFRTDF